ncbi:NAD-dependent epimerase/dehydratase family protein [Rathayibacter sp. VKM Ac-2803]|uniref:NAD-dependent epimerase/dehydratase family protein n=1 Tax=unclassified Rathayibacter TaxID=2609250 RepID=UPI0013592F7E|nr:MULTISPECIES: NAD-dependent epimerase/dehydratase family protein [unclassified Rathayibacter]MWV47988.1 NAD-dependent epimerase/dehydratase family protein [Rathayibacter sp. VKM Ac-2803]MWV58787.1 NAD-dependent epimerase/dehydratase family protein [Rathayibacter sp. VKM Ac-2754]
MSAERRRVLITGATGFLGGYAVREFLAAGDEVIAAGRNPAALERLRSEGAETIEADLAQLAAMPVRADVLVHSAALSSPWGRWSEFHEANVAGTEAMIDLAQSSRIRRLVFVSSPSIYSARRHQFAVREDDFDPDSRMSLYIRSKIEAERLLQAALASGRLEELVILRPRGLIGVGDPSLIPRFVAASRRRGIPLFDGGRNIVDVTCVENAAHALLLAASAPVAPGSVYNITNGEPQPFGVLLDRFFDAMGETPRYLTVDLRILSALAVVLEKVYALLPRGTEPPFTRYTVATLAYAQTLDISRARAELGYEPTVPLAEGIRRVGEHYRDTRG